MREGSGCASCPLQQEQCGGEECVVRAVTLGDFVVTEGGQPETTEGGQKETMEGDQGVALAATALALLGVLLLLLLLLLLVYCCRQGQGVAGGGGGRGEEKVTMMEEFEKVESRQEGGGKERSSVCDMVTAISTSWAAVPGEELVSIINY